MGELREMWEGAVDFLRGPNVWALSGRDASAGNEEGSTRPEVRTSRPESIPLDDPLLRELVEAAQYLVQFRLPHTLAVRMSDALTALTTRYPSLASPETKE